MLTQTEINDYFESERIAESNSPVGYDLQSLRNICDQAIMAIDLSLQAAFDSIRINMSGGVNPCKGCKFRRWLKIQQEENDRLRDEIFELNTMNKTLADENIYLRGLAGDAHA